MGKISQEKADKAATKITEPLQAKIDNLNKQISEKLTGFVISNTPAEVMALYKTHPGYFTDTNSIYLDGEIYCRYSICERVPVIRNNMTFELTKSQYAKILALHNEKLNTHEEYKKAVSEIKNTILALGTENRVKVDFPEAYSFIEIPTTNTGMMVNISAVRMLACSLIPGCEPLTITFTND